MNRDVFLALLAMDSYNRGSGGGLNGLSESEGIGGATIRTFQPREQDGWEEAGFYAIAYEMTGVEGFSAGEKVISYRGTDNYNPLAPGNDLWNGWTLGAGFADASQGGLAAQLS